MPEPTPQRLVAKVEEFADELGALLSGVFPGQHPDFLARVTEGESTLVIIEQDPPTGIELTAAEEPLLRLTASYRCSWDHAGEFLAVLESTFAVFTSQSDEPLFRYDFIESDGKVPGAHLNVHGHRDEMVFALTSAGRRLRGRARSATVSRGRVPRLASFHFPLGGPRFRPSLEDVVEIVVREFGLDTNPGWERAVQTGRSAWREKQLRSAVRDDPESAADTLTSLGYTVSWPDGQERRPRRDERILAL
ncbi:hypothetical protein [Actinotalea sp. Marseille-Q4924]|uniref:hypothetical protein n=1 Tax=Actinotalea sp. Marseille-Q4924 TaxID=2866571 RepID=UPI001CE3BD28|nr:hypothetical protein [Actinotalea sp. Marseille-Q4924]